MGAAGPVDKTRGAEGGAGTVVIVGHLQGMVQTLKLDYRGCGQDKGRTSSTLLRDGTQWKEGRTGILPGNLEM